MLTGRVAFDGSTVADRTAAILGRDPDWSALPGATPFAVQRLLRRCLEKDPKRRLHDIADARLDIDEALSPATHSVSTATRASRRQWNISAWAAAGLLVIGIAAVLVMNRARQESPLGTARMPTRFVVQPPPHVVLDGPLVLRTFDVSPDGSLLVFEATEGGVRRLYLRRLDQFGATPIGGTEGARQPFFSHDGRFVGFWANQQIKRVGVTAAAAPVVVCDAKTLTLANWGDDDTIVFRGGIAGSMQRVPADGGAPRAIMTPDTSHGEIDQHDPRLLPGSKAVMFTSHRDQNRFRIEALVLATGERKPIVDPGFDARYLPSGHLVYSDGRSLLAVPFDLDRLEVKAAPVKLVDDVVMELRNGIATYSLSAAGTLVYQADADRSGRTLVWVDRSGNETAIPVSPRAFIAPRVSPDGKRIAFGTADRERRDIWVYDLAGDTLNRLTREHDNQTPIWTPDGQRVAYTSIRNGLQHLVWQPADGSAPAESLVSGPNDLEAAAWTPDGRALLYVDTPPTDNSEILVLPAEGERKARRFLYGSTSTRHPSLSPDGRWATFTAWESGRGEIYVDAFPGLGSRHQVTVDGGHESKWSRDGRQLFYRSGDAMFAAPVDAARSFSAGKPVLLFRRRYVADPVFGLDYDAAPDGRFLMIKPSEEELRPPQLNVVVNWIHEVTRRVPLR
jgi:Tol biopolymer transport system component